MGILLNKNYVEYQVIVKHLNEDREIVEQGDYNNKSFRDMRKLYKETKDQFKNECVTIEFVGITEDGQNNLFFSKDFLNEDLKIKQEAQEFKSKTSQDLFQDLIKITNEILKRRDGALGEELGAVEKMKSINEHIMEAGMEDARSRLITYAKLQECFVQRRHLKNEIKLMDSVFGVLNTKYDLKTFASLIQTSMISHEQQVVKINEKIADNNMTLENTDKFKVFKEVSFRNYKEKFKLVDQLKKEYRKVIVDDANMKLLCYNNSRK